MPRPNVPTLYATKKTNSPNEQLAELAALAGHPIGVAGLPNANDTVDIYPVARHVAHRKQLTDNIRFPSFSPSGSKMPITFFVFATRCEPPRVRAPGAQMIRVGAGSSVVSQRCLGT
eukprot:gene16325-biopygen18787